MRDKSKERPAVTTKVGTMLAAGLVVDAVLAIVEVAPSLNWVPLELTKPLESAPDGTPELAMEAGSSDVEAWDSEGAAVAEAKELAAETTTSSTSKL